MKKIDKIDKIFAYLKELYPDPKTELNYSTDFQLMVAVIMSAQTTDKQVNKATDKLFKIVKKPGDVAKIWFDKFEDMIKSVNYYKSKARNLWKLSEILVKLDIPDSVEWLKELPWIWEKSAKVISHVLWWEKVIAVDTHVHRVSNRIWLVKTNKPEETSKLLEKVVPDKYKSLAHHLLVLFGRYHCMAKKPMCDDCKLKDICVYYKSIN